jgi:hypothetical protein
MKSKNYVSISNSAGKNDLTKCSILSWWKETQEVRQKMNITLYIKGHIWQANLYSGEKFNAFHLD